MTKNGLTSRCTGSLALPVNSALGCNKMFTKIKRNGGNRQE